tara:strand:- start:216 stop:413 length:198 start_codon:yes stop_codon:yes gene_type:complete
MDDFLAAQDTISPLAAVLWMFYPMAALVLVELILRAFNDDDDDDGGKGIRIRSEEMTPAYAPSGA